MNPTYETYKELQHAFNTFNRELFDDKLPRCLITLQREKNTCGYYSYKRFANLNGQVSDEISLNPSYFAVTTIVEVLQTLTHEMVHALQHHFGTPGRARYHNSEWGDMMESIGLMPSDTGRPGGKKTGDHMSDYAIEGGRFLKVCEHLVSDEFKLSWYDRFPIPKVALSGLSSHSTQLQNLSEAASSIILNQPNSQVIIQTSQNYQAIKHALDPSQPESEIVNSPESISQTSYSTPKKQTRVKYQCTCGINIWSKPNINVLCGTCNTKFEAIQF